MVTTTYTWKGTDGKIHSSEANGFVDKPADQDGYYRIKHCSLQEVKGKGKVKNWFWDKTGEYSTVHWNFDHGKDGTKVKKGRAYQIHGITKKALPVNTAHPDEHDDEAVGTFVHTDNLNLCLFCQWQRNQVQATSRNEVLPIHKKSLMQEIQVMTVVTVPLFNA